ncbi:MAG: family 16 glycosylhydrolase, partial [Alloprevotella sp.]
KKGGNSRYMEGLDYDYWHIFAVEWDATSITWYVDGKKMWSYLKSTNQSELKDGQWPFDAPFYLILNQSVGSGAWAKPADTSFTYETQFDWVRVYRKQEDILGISDVHRADASCTPSACYDLSGRLLTRAPKQGVFIQNGKLIMR